MEKQYLVLSGWLLAKNKGLNHKGHEERKGGKAQSHANLKAASETHANLGWSGMMWDAPGGRGVLMASPIQVLHSRQERPLFQDDRLKRGEFTPRGLG